MNQNVNINFTNIFNEWGHVNKYFSITMNRVICDGILKKTAEYLMLKKYKVVTKF